MDAEAARIAQKAADALRQSRLARQVLVRHPHHILQLLVCGCNTCMRMPADLAEYMTWPMRRHILHPTAHRAAPAGVK